MTATIIESDTTLFEALDFQFAPPCENHNGCSNTAVWAATIKCCLYVRLLCERCTEIIREFDARDDVVVACGACNTEVETPIILNYERL